MNRLLLALALVGAASAAAAFTVWRPFYVQATPKTQSSFLRIFDLGRQMQPYVRRRCSHSFSATAQSGWRSALHSRYFRESLVIPAKNWPQFLTTLNQTVTQELSLDDARILGRFSNAQGAFGFDYADGHTLGTVYVYPTAAKGSQCFSCGNVAAEELVIGLGVSIQEKWYDTRPDETAINRFVQDAAFKKMAARDEIALLVGDLSAAQSFQSPACAAAIRTKLQDEGISVTLDSKNPREVAFTYPDAYFPRK